MDRNYQSDAVQSIPDLTTLKSNGYPTNGNPALAVTATLPGAAWFYAITEEIRNALVACGITPDPLKVNQLAEAITQLATTSIAGRVKLSSSIGDASDDSTAVPTDALVKAYVQSLISGISGLPSGSILPYAGATIPDDYLLCNGSVVSRTTYANLFDAIGTLYGEGDGSTTFQLPDLRDRVIQGSSATHALAEYLEAGLPNILGGNIYILQAGGNVSEDTGAFVMHPSTSYAAPGTPTPSSRPITGFNASLSNDLYGDSPTVQPCALNFNYIIKS